MSSVRMCDKCGTIFSELSDGWQTFSATTMIEDDDTGEQRQVQQRLDACPACALKPKTTRRFKTDQDKRLAALEASIGMNPDTGLIEHPVSADEPAGT